MALLLSASVLLQPIFITVFNFSEERKELLSVGSADSKGPEELPQEDEKDQIEGLYAGLISDMLSGVENRATTNFYMDHSCTFDVGVSDPPPEWI